MNASLFDLAPESIPSNFRFDGPEYRPEHDQKRLVGQCLRIRDLMLDGSWRTVSEISFHTGDPEPSISAQLRHLRRPRFGSYIVERRARGNRAGGLYEYRVLAANPSAPPRDHGGESKRIIQGLRLEVARLKSLLRLKGGAR